jgi:hypothetical protein
MIRSKRSAFLWSVAPFGPALRREGAMSGSTREGIDMEAVKQETLLGKTIPPLDAAAPIRTETATFAMG